MTVDKVDVLLVGGGVMSATLATLLNELAPLMHMTMVERLPSIATESTDAWNNAGTGHAGYCELNYTPTDDAGNISINRALAINASFEVSLQLWASLVEKNALPAPAKFINKTPHLSFVWGEENVAFLRKRHRLLQEHPLFKDMEFSDDTTKLTEWMPLMMQQRTDNEKVAATRVSYGSDIDFGSLTRELVKHLQQTPSFQLNVSTEVTGLKQLDNGRWLVNIKDLTTKKQKKIEAGFVFLGAGGGALKLLQKSGIPESQGYGGFPVSGQWLVCNNPDIIKQHNSKVYGKAAIGAPPMSVPHLDTRIINGKPALLFGPYAGFTTKFLKKGSYLDLFKSVKPNNLKSLLGAGRHNMDLTRYLIGEALQKHSSRVTTLREFYPLAADADWHLESAGKRVQIIKQCDEKGGKLEFGTEIVAAKDGSIAGLLGASPGASVSVQAMINVIERCFSDKIKTEQWRSRIKALIPSYGESLIDDSQLLAQVRNRTLQVLNLR
ncbi:malate dehydrogenase (quinone) [Methylotenera oryzisoli]|uniref:Probable malate:quinone oxidoreductase n=1 Tax=Methylotenera oryzisoli TaxID=2080758 RepID=A0A4Y9VSA6_9PROT|nr:malate dehydrogenase (quinone) [Methylotenera oryzisoli]TFW71648.1 malate dehydrogenase (quinone) [Methylotenera oryzisoli]